MADKRDLEVVIVGAGATGLLLAQGLKLNGIKATVYEREDESTYLTRPREWGMTLHFGQEYLAKCIPRELMARLKEAYCDEFYTGKHTSWPMFNGQTGDKFFDMQGFNPLRVSRRKLRALLSDGVDVRYGRRIVSVSVSQPNGLATATFADGSTATGDLVVGCEGVHSYLREALVGKEQAANTPIDIQMFNTCWTLPRDVAVLQRKAHPLFRIGYHPMGMTWVTAIQDVKDPNDPTTFLFQQCLSWPGRPHADDFQTQQSKIDFIKSKAEAYAEPWKSAGLNIPPDLQPPLQVDAVAMWRPDIDWSTTSPLWPHVTLAGDAAHNIPPFRGQGLNNAFQDAEKLVSELVEAVGNRGSKTLEHAVRAYEGEMKSRSLKEIEVSLMQSRMVHNWETLMGAPFMKVGMNAYRDEVKGHMETASGGRGG
ncbi:uncharacterized protein Z520_08539 [Fonsecaea multimorphosa CBS 102226]|uniref:FAD-binding domain-containing protein n=1 Tax=Fonsecaea multimorphosa CBS 102226 TaxID=1442371 RepID=A0A0D2IFE6_9EURO|nr:uncharacterized protein Z520_08539 [Fonsecaea multimorphosa CBS 102226]KIX95831.1 hypothetical protein Z520_08539 [Fonsecaea multimorphosa CBS 102226]OAL21566.1 hypothetical protein AYO22_07962 [Fonsecaea multimorphosa]